MRHWIHIALIVAFTAFIAGCPQGGGGPAKSNVDAAKKSVPRKKSRFPIDNLAPTTVVIRVNGRAITQADYRNWYRMRDRIYRVREGIPPNVKNDKTISFAQENRRIVPSDLIQRELMRQEAERIGVEVPEARVRRLEKRFMAAIRRPKDPFSSIDRIFGEATAAELRKLVLADARDELTLEMSATNDLLNVTEAEIDAQIRWVKEWNAQAEAKSREQREKALKAKHDILNGGYFYEITTNRADLAKEDGREWQTVELGEFQADEPLAKWLATAKPGDISDPIDMEDGMAIVGLKAAYMGDAPEGVAPSMQYELVRCTFYAYDKIDEIEDRKELAAEMLNARRRDALQALGKRLSGAAKIEFPKGQAVFAPKARKPPAPKKMQKKPGKRKNGAPSPAAKTNATESASAPAKPAHAE